MASNSLTEGQEILDGRFKIVKKLGSGAFGEIFKVEKKKTGEMFAAKIEKAQKSQKHVMLFWESKLIHKLRGKTSVPALFYIGTDNSVPNHSFHVMVMDMLGPSLEDLFQTCRTKFDLKTCLLISI
jgi:serine/threonine protein kinase